MSDLKNSSSSSANNGDSKSKTLSRAGGRSRKDVKNVVEFSRKLMYSLNGDSPSNISFAESASERVYFLGGTRKGDITIKYVDLKDIQAGEKLVGQKLFDDAMSLASQLDSGTTRQLTREEQLLRERKRCSFNGITSFCLDSSHRRLVFSENSELFYFDDNGSGSNEQPVVTNSKGTMLNTGSI